MKRVRCSSGPVQVLRGVRIRSLVLFDGPCVLVSTGEIRSLTLSVGNVGRCEHSTEESDTDVEHKQANVIEPCIQGRAAMNVRPDCLMLG